MEHTPDDTFFILIKKMDTVLL